MTDQFGNATSGATVTWTRTTGSGALSSTTSVSAADGTANVTYTRGAATVPKQLRRRSHGH
ncbi:MAG: hypothetical protein ABI085_10195 [Gemmatimonadaceae bacterium]